MFQRTRIIQPTVSDTSKEKPKTHTHTYREQGRRKAREKWKKESSSTDKRTIQYILSQSERARKRYRSFLVFVSFLSHHTNTSFCCFPFACTFGCCWCCCYYAFFSLHSFIHSFFYILILISVYITQKYRVENSMYVQCTASAVYM